MRGKTTTILCFPGRTVELLDKFILPVYISSFHTLALCKPDSIPTGYPWRWGRVSGDKPPAVKGQVALLPSRLVRYCHMTNFCFEGLTWLAGVYILIGQLRVNHISFNPLWEHTIYGAHGYHTTHVHTRTHPLHHLPPPNRQIALIKFLQP